MIGIDFGTSNSTVGYTTQSGPALIELEPGQTAIPSAIFVHTEGSELLFGRSALDAYVSGEEGRLLRSLKSILGSALFDGLTEVGTRQIEYKTLLQLFFAHLKSRAEQHLQRSITAAVIGRPVWFVDDSPEADDMAQQQLADIAHSCGIPEVYFQFEPIAAALNYERQIEREELALVADIGGGTADFSAIRLSGSRHRQQDRSADILANTGVHVGGTDFDRGLSLLRVMPALGYRSHMKMRPELEMPVGPFLDLATWHRIQLLYAKASVQLVRELYLDAQEPELLQRLLNIVERRQGHLLASDVEMTKIAAAQNTIVDFSPPYISPPLSLEIGPSDLAEASIALLEKLRERIQECIAEAGLEPSEITTLILTGGTTAIPAVRALCSAETPNATIIEADRFGSVGLGLAVDAHILARTNSDCLERRL